MAGRKQTGKDERSEKSGRGRFCRLEGDIVGSRLW